MARGRGGPRLLHGPEPARRPHGRAQRGRTGAGRLRADRGPAVLRPVGHAWTVPGPDAPLPRGPQRRERGHGGHPRRGGRGPGRARGLPQLRDVPLRVHRRGQGGRRRGRATRGPGAHLGQPFLAARVPVRGQRQVPAPLGRPLRLLRLRREPPAHRNRGRPRGGLPAGPLTASGARRRGARRGARRHSRAARGPLPRAGPRAPHPAPPGAPPHGAAAGPPRQAGRAARGRHGALPRGRALHDVPGTGAADHRGGRGGHGHRARLAGRARARAARLRRRRLRRDRGARRAAAGGPGGLRREPRAAGAVAARRGRR